MKLHFLQFLLFKSCPHLITKSFQWALWQTEKYFGKQGLALSIQTDASEVLPNSQQIKIPCFLANSTWVGGRPHPFLIWKTALQSKNGLMASAIVMIPSFHIYIFNRKKQKNQISYLYIFMVSIYATSTQAPPTALIFSSARRLKNLAFTIKGCLGKTPLPRTL